MATSSSKIKRQKANRQRKGRRPGAILLVAALFLAAAAGYLFFTPSEKAAAPPTPAGKDFTAQQQEALLGKWRRPDGGYVIQVREIDENGQATVAYYNPNPINVARAMVLTHGTRTGLFVELQDRGYPGATYELEYNGQQDLLAGVYHQPAAGGSFNVIFVRIE